jgi:hypothetical protein
VNQQGKIGAMLKRLLLGLLVLWSGVSLLAEARRAVTSWDARAGRETWPGGWRLGSPPVARLEACLAGARRLLPAGSAVAFAAPGESAESALFDVRWAAYLMPEQNVFGHSESTAAGVARYVISWRKPLAGPGLAKLRPVRQLPGCFLYQAIKP